MREIEEQDKLRKIEEREKIRIYELEKLKIESANKVKVDNPNVNRVILENVTKSKYEFQRLMHRYDSKEGYISFYLVIFERQARRANFKEEFWVSHLLGALPYELTQLIAQESENKANDYKHDY